MAAQWAISLIPIVTILILMVVFRWGAAKAGPAGWLAAMIIASIFFGADLRLLALVQTKALLLTLDVLMIVWGAFLLYRVVDEAGAIQTIGGALPHLTADRGMQALLIGWAFSSFLQGAGGFGVPVAVTAPLLVGLGFSPLAAVVIPAVGHAWAVTFGSLASSFQALIATSNLPGELLASPSALVLGVPCILSGFMVVHAADGWSAVRRLTPAVLVIGGAMAGTQYLLAANGLWNIAGFGAGTAGLVIGIPLSRNYRGVTDAANEETLDGRTVLAAFSGYLVLIVITLVIQLVEPVQAFLGQVVVRVPFPEMRTRLDYVTPAGLGRTIALFRHTGVTLAYTSIAACVIYAWSGRIRTGAVRRIIHGVLKGVVSPSLGIATMVGMSVVMSHAGMTDILARGLAEGVGNLLPLASPWIGSLGTFMTGSNTNSNVLFAMMQRRTAELLNYSVTAILAIQTAGGSVASMIAPTKLVVGASTTGMAGQEGEVLTSVLRYFLVVMVVLSLLSLALLKVFS